MKAINVAVLGATGAVGKMIIQLLQERCFPVGELRLLASRHSAGKQISFQERKLLILEVKEDSFEGMDVIFGAVENTIALQYTPLILKSGALFIDNSSAYRLESKVPLIIPEINPEDILKHHGIISNPNCATILALEAIYPIHRLSPIKRMVVSTYQAVSGAGLRGMKELQQQVEEKSGAEPVVFPFPIAFNVIPQIGDFDEEGYSSEENKLQKEGRKILHHPTLQVSCTCVRVPVYRCHSESIYIETEDELSLRQIRSELANAKGVILSEDPYPTPYQCSDRDEIFVGRIRKDRFEKKGIHLWCCGDQLRKGAATNAVQIAETALLNGDLKRKETQ